MTEIALPGLAPGAATWTELDLPATGVVLLPAEPDARRLSRIGWLGSVQAGLDPAGIARTVADHLVAESVHHASPRTVALLAEVAAPWFGQPGLRGCRLGAGQAEQVGTDWSSAFIEQGRWIGDRQARIEATDPARGLALLTELECLTGGAIRTRLTITNQGPGQYLVEGLDVLVPVPDRVSEILDLTGRWGRERSPQRHRIVDGCWLREGRTGKTGADSATVLSVGTAGFGFAGGEVWGVHLAWSGNSRHFVERQPSGLTVLGAGELLLPGEIVLEPGEQYRTPWVFYAASTEGLDGVASQFHGYLRGLPAHPSTPRPVTCNVWEAVYFDHDLTRLHTLAGQAAEIGVERFVLDDGWFGSRRDDRSGLGDWTVSEQAWPDGLDPLIDRVRELGMSFGLWFEPEMVNPDSELFRAHPDWVLGVLDRPLPRYRHQLVLDLGLPEVRDYLFDQVHAMLARYRIDYVKWDHNRSLAEPATGAWSGAPGAHAQTLGFYALLDRLRAAHPGLEWESCGSGGGRIDLAVLERCERVWTSDMTDALARQPIQRWTTQLVPPEYLGAHVSATVNHQTGRQLSLDFRAATAMFGQFGVEWDISQATPDERARLAEWIGLHKRHRSLLHSGRTVRVDTGEHQHWVYGVLAPDRSAAVFAYVQLDETVRDPVPFLVPGLDPSRSYLAREIAPAMPAEHPSIAGYRWRGDGLQLTGAVLAAVGLPAPQRWPQSALLVHLQAL